MTAADCSNHPPIREEVPGHINSLLHDHVPLQELSATVVAAAFNVAGFTAEVVTAPSPALAEPHTEGAPQALELPKTKRYPTWTGGASTTVTLLG